MNLARPHAIFTAEDWSTGRAVPVGSFCGRCGMTFIGFGIFRRLPPCEAPATP